jgi:hypothetical protein
MLTSIVLFVSAITGIISLGFLEDVFFLKPNGRLILLTKVVCSDSSLCSKLRRANGYFNRIKFNPIYISAEILKVDYTENAIGFT